MRQLWEIFFILLFSSLVASFIQPFSFVNFQKAIKEKVRPDINMHDLIILSIGSKQYLNIYVSSLEERNCYCTFHGCEHVTIAINVEEIINLQCHCYNNVHSSLLWKKPVVVANFLQSTKAKWVMMMDLDVVIQDMDFPATNIVNKVIKSWNKAGIPSLIFQDHFRAMPNSGVFFVSNSQIGLLLLKNWIHFSKRCKGGCHFTADQGGLFDMLLHEMASHAKYTYNDECTSFCEESQFVDCGIKLFDTWGQSYGKRNHSQISFYSNDKSLLSPYQSFNRFDQADTKTEVLSSPTDFLSHSKKNQPAYTKMEADLPKIIKFFCI